MHSLQFTYKIKKQCWPHMGPFFFFFWKKNKQPLLKFSIKIHICIIIHFKAIREEWERSKENCRVSPLFVFLNRAEGSHWSCFSGWELRGATATALDLVHLGFGGTKRWIIRKKKTNGRRHCRFPCLATNSFEETKNYFRFLFFFPFKHFYLTISKTLFSSCVIPCSFKWQH